MQLSNVFLSFFLWLLFPAIGNSQDDIRILEKVVSFSHKNTYSTLDGIDTSGCAQLFLAIRDSTSGMIMEIDYSNFLLKEEVSIILTNHLDIGTLRYTNRNSGVSYNFLNYKSGDYQIFIYQDSKGFRSYHLKDGRVTHFSKKTFHIGNTVGKVLIRRRINRKLQKEIDMVKEKAMETLYIYVNASAKP